MVTFRTHRSLAAIRQQLRSREPEVAGAVSLHPAQDQHFGAAHPRQATCLRRTVLARRSKEPRLRPHAPVPQTRS
jgi:hypothetical protein